MSLDYRIFDSDNHYYEATDAFIRHIDPAYSRLFQWAEINGKTTFIVNGKVNKFIPNPTFEMIGKPGALVEYYKGDAGAAKAFNESIRDVEPIANRPEYRNRDKRLAVMNRQGIEGVWLFPTLGVGMEYALEDDPDAASAAFTSFNKWLDEDWGYNYQNRIFAAPYIPLLNLDAAVAELHTVLAKDARVICIKPGPVLRHGHYISPFNEVFDPFWALVNESGITVAIHGAASVYGNLNEQWEPPSQRAFFGRPLGAFIAHNHRDVVDTLAAAVCHGFFQRFKRIRLAIIENGSDWVPTLMKKMDMVANQYPDAFADKPSDVFRNRVWVAPFWEDDPQETAKWMGVEHTMLGSDYPHLEGVANPASYVERLQDLSAAQQRLVMRDNALALTSRLLSDL